MAMPLEILLCSLFRIRKPLSQVASTVAFLPGNVFPKCDPFELTPKILHWIKICVDMHEFFKPFKD